MDNDDQIDEISKKQEDILILVQKLWRAEKWRRFWTIFRYVIYIGVLLGAFYFVTPYVEKMIATVQQLQGVKSPEDLQKILEQIKSSP